MPLFLPLIHSLCAFLRLLLTPLSTAPSPPPSQFTVCTSRFARLRDVSGPLIVVFTHCEDSTAKNLFWFFRDVIWAAADIYYQHSCQSGFSGVYLVFKVCQERDFKETLAISFLVLQASISFLRCFRQRWRISVLGITMPLLIPKLMPISFFRRASRF